LLNDSGETVIRAIVGSAIEGFAVGFSGRHEGEVERLWLSFSPLPYL